MKKIILKENEVLVLRSVDEKLQSRNGFQYPSKGLVECSDWKESNSCGNGLHGLEFGNTIDYNICSDYNSKFLIIKVNKNDGYVVLDDGDKVKFKKGCVELVFDDYQKALNYLYDNYKGYYKSYYGFSQTAGSGSVQTAGYGSVQTAGYGSVQTAGYGSVQTAGSDSVQTALSDSVQTALSDSVQTAGSCSVQTAGYGSVQTAGSGSVQTAGYGSVQTALSDSVQTAGSCSFHCLRGERHIIKPRRYSLISIIGYGDNPDMYQFMYGKDFVDGETLLITNGVITKYTTTPDNITKLEEHEIFVFGSNGQGEHNGGAALIAKQKFGAIQGQADGLQGQSFAINTMDGLDKIEEGLQSLYKYACDNITKIFFLTKIGCGIAGYSEDEIKSIISKIVRPANVILPQGW